MTPRSPRSIRWALLALVAALLLAPAAGQAKVTFKRIASPASTGSLPNYGLARTSDGTLHLIYQTTSSLTGSAPNGLAALSISASGHLAPTVPALQGWNAGRPGLTALPNGSLAAAFGAIAPGTSHSSVWAITSSNGGSTWTAPSDISSGALESLAYGSDVTMKATGATPVLTLPQAGNLVIQQGFGPGSPTYQATNSSDGSVGDVETAVNGTGTVVASWQSLAGPGADFMQAVAPNVGSPQPVPGQLRNDLVIAGQDNASGVFAAYTPDNKNVRLLRYGGGSVGVGALKGVTPAALGVATGPAGRIWVFWGSDNGSGVAVTRSNKAVTRFEPLQRVNPNIFTLWRLAGDGRLGPLDLLADMIPNAKSAPPPGIYYGRVLPLLSLSAVVSSVKNGKGQVIAHKVKCTVTDAGDAVSGAKVAGGGKSATTNSSGQATLIFGKTGGYVTLTVTDPGYQALQVRVKL